MAPNNRNKFGLSIPIAPRWKGFDASSTAAIIPATTSHTVRSPRRPPTSPRPNPPPPPPERRTAKSTATLETTASETEELQRLVHAPPFWKSNNKKLSKQLSMQETPRRDMAWEKRRKQILRQEKRRKSVAMIPADGDDLTDADMYELRGSIELGFGFNEEDVEKGHKLCDTLPALDLYFAVNRQLSPVSTPSARSPDSSNGAQSSSSSLGSPRGGSDDSWRICGPGDSPKQVKAKLRHWAQAVACSVMMQSS